MVYIFLSFGFEEIEALAVVDVLRRAEIDIKTVGVGSKTIVGAHNIPIVCDLVDSEVNPDENTQAVVLPGGMPGTLNLEKSEKVCEFLDYMYENKKLICAICAAPSILGHKGMLKGKRAVCFPGFESELEGAINTQKYVEKDENIITARGMGSAIKFALAIGARFVGTEKMKEIEASLQCS